MTLNLSPLPWTSVCRYSNAYIFIWFIYLSLFDYLFVYLLLIYLFMYKKNHFRIITFYSRSLFTPFRYLMFSKLVSLAIFAGILYSEGCRITFDIFWLEIGRGIWALDNEKVRGRYSMTLDDFGVAIVVGLVFVEMKLFSMKEVILAFLLGLWLSTVKPLTNCLRL